jgi:glutamyl-tRNA synthetase
MWAGLHIFDMEKLLWLNGHYMKPAGRGYSTEFKPFLEASYRVTEDQACFGRRQLERTQNLEMARWLTFLQGGDRSETAAREVPDAIQQADPERFLRDLRTLPALDEAGQRVMSRPSQRARKKLVDVIQPVRVALSGKVVSPGIFEVIDILERQWWNDG